ncbi:MAG: RibD family protein [Oscillatoria sp. PMC 1068.18]|nr:RibD family protein [Oscillatoria sp. PMC 1076.18]MEC4989322.1 RibD family protein [Oscillatoria sp. PMC 1068.18]
MTFQRPHTTLILAMTADGKIATEKREAARFASECDRAHLEKQISLADAVLFGANTLRAYETTLPVTDSSLLRARQEREQSPQPVQIVCSATAEFSPKLRFFQQPVPRWLLTTPKGAANWMDKQDQFQRLLVTETTTNQVDWKAAFTQLSQLGFQRVAILGGSELVASLLAVDFIDEFWLTVCPVILAGTNAPTPVAGIGFTQAEAPKLQLLSVEKIADEVFLHYRRQR